LISLQWHVLVLTLRLALYTWFGKARSNLGKNFWHPQKYALPYTYGTSCLDIKSETENDELNEQNASQGQKEVTN